MQWIYNQGVATGQAIEDMRAIFSKGSTTLDPFVFMARLDDLTLSNSFLAVEAHLKTLEHYSRLTHVASGLSRGLVLGTFAADLVAGYKILSERERCWPHLVQPQDWQWQHRRSARRVLDTAAELGGTLIKACQFASTRPDILPAAYVQALSRLQDRVPPHSWTEMEQTIKQELGRSPQGVFARIETKPIASASIAQVHRAWLHDGREVAVKIQYPEIASVIETDLSILQRIVTEIARLYPGVQLQPILDYLKETLPLELDFRREGAAMMELRTALQHRTDVFIPAMIPELSAGRLLVMEFANGIKITDREALLKADISPSAVARLLNDVYAEQFFHLGLLHADPHPGNLLVQQGPRLVLLDHGLTVSLKPTFIQVLGEMVQALLAADFDRLNKALILAGMRIDEHVDISTLLQLVGVLLSGEQDKAALDTVDVGQQLGKSIGSIPVELILVGRALGLLDGITKQLDPDINALEIVVSAVTQMTADQR